MDRRSFFGAVAGALAAPTLLGCETGKNKYTPFFNPVKETKTPRAEFGLTGEVLTVENIYERSNPVFILDSKHQLHKMSSYEEIRSIMVPNCAITTERDYKIAHERMNAIIDISVMSSLALSPSLYAKVFMADLKDMSKGEKARHLLGLVSVNVSEPAGVIVHPEILSQLKFKKNLTLYPLRACTDKFMYVLPTKDQSGMFLWNKHICPFRWKTKPVFYGWRDPAVHYCENILEDIVPLDKIGKHDGFYSHYVQYVIPNTIGAIELI